MVVTLFPIASGKMDADSIRVALLNQLFDWDASDLKKVYEPISWHFGYFFTFCVFFLLAAWVWGAFKKFRDSRAKFVQYIRVMNNDLVIDQAVGDSQRDFRTCAVIGGNGFIGSHLVEELIGCQEQSYRVFVLGRTIPEEDKRHSKVAGYIQVDMCDYDNLIRAFASVDTVFHLGATIPTAYEHSDDSIWNGNRGGALAVVAACRAAGVKNLIYIHGYSNVGQGKSKAFVTSKYAAGEIIANANGEDGLRTCVLLAGLIFGPRDALSTSLLKGKLSILPFSGVNNFYMYVKELVYIIRAIEEKMADEKTVNILGQHVSIGGEKMTPEKFFSLPGWGRKSPSVGPKWVVMFMANLNVFCAKVFWWAPFGTALCPHVIEVLNSTPWCPTDDEALELKHVLTDHKSQSVEEGISATKTAFFA